MYLNKLYNLLNNNVINLYKVLIIGEVNDFNVNNLYKIITCAMLRSKSDKNMVASASWIDLCSDVDKDFDAPQSVVFFLVQSEVKWSSLCITRPERINFIS